MMHQALYRKYRPAVFDDVYGQGQVTDVLRYEAANDKISHAYLFCGSRGTGKTTCAKILAKAVNCENLQNGSPCCKCSSCLDIESGTATDVIEMDAASNNGVDSIRDLCEEVVYTPSMLKKKVYIIDEVHMLSQGAFNALLKTIEEPPAHVVFILATTELHKIPATVISRCQRFDFRRVDVNTLCARLLYIAESEGIKAEREALQLIARQAEGGFRDAIGLLELCSAGGADVTGERAKNILGLSGYDTVAAVMSFIRGGQMDKLFSTVAEITASSKDISVFWQELISFVRDMLVSKYSNGAAEYLDLTEPEMQLLTDTSARFTLTELIYYSKVMDEASITMSRNPQNKRITCEMSLLKMCRPELDASCEALGARIAQLEDKITLLGMGAAPVATASKAETTEKAELAIKNEEPQQRAAVDNGDLEAVRDISEAVGRLEGANRGLAQFLMSARVLVSADGKKLQLQAEGFGVAMLDKPEAKAAISEAFALAKITDGRAEVEIVKKSASKKEASISDELLSGLL